ncbi:DNA-binding transcriptional regulator, LysR family [Ferrimonas sediminum]|uniref:DNA-binding transcriptional regulator, LysR family n=1 Tax=Ferrimonas sediminum TaxID=718193 RepID=A0A1G8SVC5_9GAMM|nr:LysR family transcriptional regulator [Ferrimonas sediminum]SDJ33131.1 DNA-binding transcriptional regulator, LysR family [Ferrimonas sediminum]
MKKLRHCTLFQLTIFIEVYERLNAKEAAHALAITPAAISRGLNTLRDALGDPLFIRRQTGFERSQVAERLYPVIKRMQQLCEDTPYRLNRSAAIQKLSLFTLEIFCHLYNGTGIAQLAEQLDITLSKVNRNLKSLRLVFEDPLLIRQPGGMHPTEVAHDFYPLLRQLIMLCEEACDTGDALQDGHSVSLSITTVPQLAMSLPLTLQRAAKRHQTSLTLKMDYWNRDSINRLSGNEVDAVIAFEPANREGILSKKIIQIRSGYLVAREDHPVWEEPSPDQLLRYPLVKLASLPFPDNQSPLACYARSKGTYLEEMATVPDLGCAAQLLLNSQGFIIVGIRSAVDYLKQFKGLKAQKMGYQQDKQVLDHFSPPSTYLWLKQDAQGRLATPSWLQRCLENYVLESHQ